MLQRLFERVYSLYATLALGVVLFVFVCPAVILGPTLAIRRACGRAGVRLALFAAGVPFRVRGLQHVPSTPCVAIANHASYLDGIILTAALPPRFTFVVQDGAAGWPLIGLTIRRMGVTFVNRLNAREGAAQTRSLIRQVQDGTSLTIFAEGTFKAEPGLMAFKNGAFLIAARAGVPVLPVAIRGTRRLWGGGRKLPRWSPAEVEVLPLLAPATDVHAQREAARAAVLAACGEPDRLVSIPLEAAA